jgi:hypothetical protein
MPRLHWDGSYFYIATEGVQYNNQPPANGALSFVITASQNICDCTYPTEATDAAVALTQSTIIMGSNFVNNPATTTPAITSLLVTKTQPSQTVALFNDIQATVVCTTPALLFLTGCLLDISEQYGDPDVNIDLAACIEYNGAALTAP